MLAYPEVAPARPDNGGAAAGGAIKLEPRGDRHVRASSCCDANRELRLHVAVAAELQ